MKPIKTGPPRGNGLRRLGLNPVRRFKVVRRSGYCVPAICASPLHEELRDCLGFAIHVLKTASIHLLPMARQCLERGAEILRQEKQF